MNRNFYKGLLLALALLLLVGVGQFQKALNRQRADPKLNLTRVTPLENAPPVLAFTTVALGGFRGLIANALWMRTSDLQEEGKYFEVVQLADWITKLEPAFVHVWLVQAWNMAYNISVKFPDPGDRWRWVQRGIELLRDEGLRYNPKEALIYRELAWFFQHKMGQSLDDAHMYYKAAWAREMTNLFGAVRPNFPELLDPKSDDSRRRVEVLRDKYKMDPRLMKEVDDRYGPLEWRLPESHAIYWASAGLKQAKKKDLVTLRRVVYQSMQMAVLRGRLISVQTNAPPRYGPDLSKIDRANETYEQLIQDDDEMSDGIQKAHKNFLREIVYLLYTHNRIAEATRWMKVTREKYPDAIPAHQTLDEYSLERLTGEFSMMTYDRIKASLEGILAQYFYNLAIDEDDKAAGLEAMARQLWNFHEKKIGNQQRRLGLAPIPEMKQMVLERLLDPQNGFSPELIGRLQTKLGLPTPPAVPVAVPVEQKR